MDLANIFRTLPGPGEFSGLAPPLNFRVWNSHWERGHVTMAIPDGRSIFGSSVLQLYRTSYAVRSTFLAIAMFLVIFHMLSLL